MGGNCINFSYLRVIEVVEQGCFAVILALEMLIYSW